jgi:hypothetical protein
MSRERDIERLETHYLITKHITITLQESNVFELRSHNLATRDLAANTLLKSAEIPKGTSISFMIAIIQKLRIRNWNIQSCGKRGIAGNLNRVGVAANATRANKLVCITLKGAMTYARGLERIGGTAMTRMAINRMDMNIACQCVTELK